MQSHPLVPAKRDNTLDSENMNDWPVDYDGSGRAASPPVGDGTVISSEPVVPTDGPPSALVPSDEQWAEITQDIIRTVHEHLESHMISDDGNYLVADGHPVAWVLNRSRVSDASHRDHRLPTHPSAGHLVSLEAKQRRAAMQTYGRLVARASVPSEHQKRAAWRNFAARTARRFGRIISAGEVKFCLFPRSVRFHATHLHFTPFPTATSPNTSRPLMIKRGIPKH